MLRRLACRAAAAVLVPPPCVSSLTWSAPRSLASRAGAGTYGAARPSKGKAPKNSLPQVTKEDEEALMAMVLPPKRWAVEGFRGVWAEETAGPIVYEAVVDVNGAAISGGEFESAKEAARAYDALALMYFGQEAAKLNFPVKDYATWTSSEFNKYKTPEHIEAKPGYGLRGRGHRAGVGGDGCCVRPVLAWGVNLWFFCQRSRGGEYLCAVVLAGG